MFENKGFVAQVQLEGLYAALNDLVQRMRKREGDAEWVSVPFEALDAVLDRAMAVQALRQWPVHVSNLVGPENHVDTLVFTSNGKLPLPNVLHARLDGLGSGPGDTTVAVAIEREVEVFDFSFQDDERYLLVAELGYDVSPLVERAGFWGWSTPAVEEVDGDYETGQDAFEELWEFACQVSAERLGLEMAQFRARGLKKVLALVRQAHTGHLRDKPTRHEEETFGQLIADNERYDALVEDLEPAEGGDENAPANEDAVLRKELHADWRESLEHAAQKMREARRATFNQADKGPIRMMVDVATLPDSPGKLVLIDIEDGKDEPDTTLH